MQIFVNGIVTVTFQYEVSQDYFNEACKLSNVYPQDYKKFLEDDWLRIRKHLKQLVEDNEYSIEYHNVHDYDTISVDEVVIEDKDCTTVLYEIEDKVDSVYINDEKKL